MGWPWDRLYKTSLIKNSQLEFPTDLDNSEDGVFVYGLLYRASSLSVVRDVLIKHRSTRKGSVSNSRDKSPECFYEAICRIKRDLKKINKYELLERSFLNWALDYSIWNISTLTDKDTRSLLAKKITNGGYPELEIFDHSWRYFDLYGCNSFKGFVKLKTMQ